MLSGRGQLSQRRLPQGSGRSIEYDLNWMQLIRRLAARTARQVSLSAGLADLWCWYAQKSNHLTPQMQVRHALPHESVNRAATCLPVVQRSVQHHVQP